MNVQQIAVVFYNIAGLVVLWGMASLWRGYRIDKLRQDIFNLRADLFEFAAAGGIDFEDGYYRRLRAILNSMIRFAHQVSFVRLVIALALERWRPIFANRPSFSDDLQHNYPCGAARSKLEEVHNRLMKLVTIQVVTTSVIAAPAIMMYAVYSFRRAAHYQMAKDFAYRMSVGGQVMERQAVETRELEIQRREAPVCV